MTEKPTVFQTLDKAIARHSGIVCGCLVGISDIYVENKIYE